MIPSSLQFQLMVWRVEVGFHWYSLVPFSVAFVNIIEAIVRFSEASGETVYQCRADGEPLPLQITWMAEDGQGNIVDLTGNVAGVQIITLDEASSELRLNRTDLSSVSCTATNGDYPGAVSDQFVALSGMCVHVAKLRAVKYCMGT